MKRFQLVNAGGQASDELVERYRVHFPEANDEVFFLTIEHAMEGSCYEGITGGAWMREDNLQLSQPQHVSTLKKMGDDQVKYDVERTGMGPKTDFCLEVADTPLPTTCEMKRP